MPWEIQSQPEPPRNWTRSTRAAWAATLFAQIIWAVPAKSAWVIPFGVAGLVALTLGSVAIYQIKTGGGPLTARLVALLAALGGSLAATRLYNWYEKYS